MYSVIALLACHPLQKLSFTHAQHAQNAQWCSMLQGLTKPLMHTNTKCVQC